MELLYKVKDKIRGRIYSRNIGKSWYLKLYVSYWHSKYHKAKPIYKNYLAARPHPDAGIGHQMANWIAGYWFAKVFDLRFAHIPFSKSHEGIGVTPWEDFLGFGVGEKRVSDLVKHEGYKIVRIPFFDEEDSEEISVINSIIDSYADRKTIFLCEQNQYFKNQYLVADELQNKFYSVSAKRKGANLFSNDQVNIAVHVRRGDIVQTAIPENEQNTNLSMRWLDDNYYINAIEQVLNLLDTQKKVQIFLFSQGNEEDFQKYRKFKSIRFCLDVSARDSFEHMCCADILITSKSSFSYKPALLNRGIKVCPADFWHGYPDSNDWLLADNNGAILSPHPIVIK